MRRQSSLGFPALHGPWRIVPRHFDGEGFLFKAFPPKRDMKNSFPASPFSPLKTTMSSHAFVDLQRVTLHKTNSSHLKIGHHKFKSIFQPFIFRGKLAVSF